MEATQTPDSPQILLPATASGNVHANAEFEALPSWRRDRVREYVEMQHRDYKNLIRTTQIDLVLEGYQIKDLEHLDTELVAMREIRECMVSFDINDHQQLRAALSATKEVDAKALARTITDLIQGAVNDARSAAEDAASELSSVEYYISDATSGLARVTDELDDLDDEGAILDAVESFLNPSA